MPLITLIPLIIEAGIRLPQAASETIVLLNKLFSIGQQNGELSADQVQQFKNDMAASDLAPYMQPDAPTA